MHMFNRLVNLNKSIITINFLILHFKFW